MRRLGIDYGSKYIGLALAEDTFVSPLKVLSYSKDNDTIASSTLSYICQIISRERIDEVVIGLPFLDGKETEMAHDVREFTNKLKKKFLNGPFASKAKFKFVDESYTSEDSVAEMLRSGVSKEKRSNDHAYSANILLKRYIEG